MSCCGSGKYFLNGMDGEARLSVKNDRIDYDKKTV